VVGASRLAPTWRPCVVSVSCAAPATAVGVVVSNARAVQQQAGQGWNHCRCCTKGCHAPKHNQRFINSHTHETQLLYTSILRPAAAVFLQLQLLIVSGTVRGVIVESTITRKLASASH
jgi:hypothetical protein